MSVLATVVTGGVSRTLTDWSVLSGAREGEAWTWRRVDARGRYLGTLDGVERGGLEINVGADIRSTGSLSWSGAHGSAPDWRNTFLQPMYSFYTNTGSLVRWPMGVYLCSSPGTGHDSTGIESDVRLFDRTLILERTKLTKEWGVQVNKNIVTQVRYLLSQAGLSRYVIDDSTETTRTPMVWEAGTSYLRVINDLLDSINYFGIWADANGVLRSGEYTEPESRPLRWAFDEGNAAIHDERVQHEEDDFDVPNRVTVISRGDGYTFELVTTAVLDDIRPNHRYSFERTGMWIDRVEDGVDITSDPILRAHAKRLLLQGLGVASTAGLTHAPMPLEVHDRVSLDTSGLVIGSATVQSMGISCAPGEDWDTTIREVA